MTTRRQVLIGALALALPATRQALAAGSALAPAQETALSCASLQDATKELFRTCPSVRHMVEGSLCNIVYAHNPKQVIGQAVCTGPHTWDLTFTLPRSKAP